MCPLVILPICISTTAAGNPKADSLVNFSRNSMDINGTINAMGKNGAGTGNIYFLTPQGITVGANGMINATNIYMAVPSSAMMDRLIVDDNYTSNIVGWGENFNANANDTSFPLNPSGTITIEKASSLNYTNSAQLLAKTDYRLKMRAFKELMVVILASSTPAMENLL
jgi:filamentous hemagglutinin family protein